jgi:hypothetical protein
MTFWKYENKKNLKILVHAEENTPVAKEKLWILQTEYN